MKDMIERQQPVLVKYSQQGAETKGLLHEEPMKDDTVYQATIESFNQIARSLHDNVELPHGPGQAE